MEKLDSANREERERLFPSLTNPSWLVLRKRRQILQDFIAQFEGDSLDVLDIGGRIQPYRPLLASRSKRYVAIDLERTPMVDVLGRGESLPFPSGQFDLAICTQVLQYVAEPAAVIMEIHRTLKPGGSLFLSVPAIAMQDSDEECWRFFPYAIRRLLGIFSSCEVIPEGSSIAGFFRSINGGLNLLARYPVLRSCFQFTLCPVLNVTGALLDECVASNNFQFTANYSALARK